MSTLASYEPSDWGKRFHGLTCREALGAGSAGPGKSLILLHDSDARINMEHERCMLPTNHPHFHPFGSSMGKSLHLRRLSIQLKETIRRSKHIFPALDPGAKYNEQDAEWTFSSGYKYQFGHCKDPDDWGNYQSAEYDWIGFDELTQFEEEQYEQITTRLRSSDPLLRTMLKIRAMSNPMMTQEKGVNISVKNIHWVRDRFVEPCREGNKMLERRIKMRDGTIEKQSSIYLPARLSDNPDKEFARDYEKTLAGKPAHIRRALLEGDWYVMPNAFFGVSWRAELHVCKPFKVPLDWLVFRSMDWGFKTYGCVHWWAMDLDETLWCIREYSFRKKHVREVAQRVKQIEKEDLKIRYYGSNRSPLLGPADIQLWEDRGGTGPNKADEMAAEGVIWLKADKGPGSRASGAGKILTRLDDHDDGTCTPGLVFFSNCERLIKTMPAIPPDANDPEAPQDGGDDHWLDSARYAVVYASNGRAGIQKPMKPRKDDDDSGASVRGRYGYGLH